MMLSLPICLGLFVILASALFEDEVQKSPLVSARNAGGYQEAQVFRINKSFPALDIITNQGLNIWRANENFIDVMVEKEKVKSVKTMLTENGVPYTVQISDLEAAILQQNPPKTSMRSFKDLPIDFERYNRLGDIYNYLDYLEYNYPQLVTVGVIGYTAKNKTIKYIKILSGIPNANVVFIDGGIHAREWIAPASVIYIISQLVENRRHLPEDLLHVDFYIVPVLNPDGYEYTHTTDRMWRKNRSGSGKCLGTDVNRNFGIRFGLTGTSGDPCSEIYRGRGPNSELETRALTRLLLQLKGRIMAYITFHSYGQYILIPYAYDYGALPPDYDDMEKVARDASSAMELVDGRHYKYGNAAKLMYPAAGGSDDWAKSHAGVKYAYTIELADSGEHGFLLPHSDIVRTAKEAFEAVKVIASAALVV